MDVKLDSAIIRAERGKRGWSQEQLAAAAGLGVRTIQRIESSGTASAESAKCLAAVFELSLQDLVVTPRDLRSRTRGWAAAATVFVTVVSSLLLMSRANATNVAMAVALDTATGESRMNVEVQSGQQTEINLEKDIRLLLTPTLQKDGNILLSVVLYGWDGRDFKLVGKPRLLMRQGVETRLRLDLHNGQIARIGITPKAK